MPRTTLLVAAAAALAVPPAAMADVSIEVPARLLGGRVAPAKPLPPPPPAQPGAVVDPDDLRAVDLAEPGFWDLVWPGDAGPIQPPAELQADCDETARPGSCGLWNDAAAGLVPESAGVATAERSPPPATLAVAARLRPRLGAWMTDQTPRLRWRPAPGATGYNVQIYLGPRRVASAWTRRPSVVVPPRVIHQGRYYMWSVWPGFGSRRHPRFGTPVGRSVFGVVLRPRIVFRAAGGGVEGEVRPRIPRGLLALRWSGPRAGRVPARIRIDGRSRIRLRLTVSEAERLGATLLDPGPRPPKGLRRPAARSG